MPSGRRGAGSARLARRGAGTGRSAGTCTKTRGGSSSRVSRRWAAHCVSFAVHDKLWSHGSNQIYGDVKEI